MKPYAILTLFCILMFAAIVGAQTAGVKPSAHIENIVRAGGNVTVSLTASTPFVNADNIYVLHIGNSEFSHYRLVGTSKQNSLVYNISEAAFREFAEGTPIYLTYGKVKKEGGRPLDELALDPKTRCWQVGTVSNIIDKK